MPTKTKRPFLRMECEVCKSSNYHIQVTKGKTIEKRPDLKKFCRKCRQHTVHKMKLK